MAKAPSKIMSIADKKAAQANIKLAIKGQSDLAKTVASDLKAVAALHTVAMKAHAAVGKDLALKLGAAKKAADALVAAAVKDGAVAQKAADAALATSAKVLAAAQVKHDKQAAAAVVGAAKLSAQAAALDAAPTAAAAPAPKATAVAKSAPVATANAKVAKAAKVDKTEAVAA